MVRRGRPTPPAPRPTAPPQPRHYVRLCGLAALHQLRRRTTKTKSSGCWHCAGSCYSHFKDREKDIIQWRTDFLKLSIDRQEVELCQMFYGRVPGGLMGQSPSHPPDLGKMLDQKLRSWEAEMPHGHYDTSDSDDSMEAYNQAAGGMLTCTARAAEPEQSLIGTTVSTDSEASSGLELPDDMSTSRSSSSSHSRDAGLQTDDSDSSLDGHRTKAIKRPRHHSHLAACRRATMTIQFLKHPVCPALSP
jgi:hypothetical protein